MTKINSSSPIRVLVVLLVAIASIWWVISEPARPGKPRQPNLLVVTLDTTRADRLGCYGFEEARTPTIDRLAREGVKFTDAYAQAPQTMPNHSSLFTGLYTITHNVLSNGQRLKDDAITLAEVLKANGYRTGAVVSAAPLMTEFNLNQGFDFYYDEFSEDALVGGFKAFLRFFSANKINLPTERPAHRTTAHARDWLSRQKGRKKPFFFWVHYFDPHDPYEYRPDFKNPEAKADSGKKNRYGEKEANYINEIEFVDYSLGKLLAFMGDAGLLENTLIVLTADHGESLGEHGYRGHRQDVYQNIIRVPLILHWPGKLKAGRELGTPAMTIDIMPTILKLLEIPYLSNSFQGEDLLALDDNQPRRLFSVAVKLFTKSPIRKTIVYGDWKFIEFDQAERNALYNLREDPEENNNLVGTELAKNAPLDWLQELQIWFERYGRLEFSDFKMSPEQAERLRSLGYVQD